MRVSIRLPVLETGTIERLVILRLSRTGSRLLAQGASAAAMCKALLEGSPSSSSTPSPSTDNGVRPGGATRAGATVAAAATAPVSQGGLDNATRYRRPRSSGTCQGSTDHQQQQQQCSSQIGSSAIIGSSALGESGCTATERLPPLAVGENGVPVVDPAASFGRCPTCSLCTRGGVGHAGQQNQQQQQPSERPLPGAAEMWGLERAVAAGRAAWGGGGEWLGLLRKRHRSAGTFPW